MPVPRSLDGLGESVVPPGGVPEWTIGAVSKTVVAFLVTVGSNPTPSANIKPFRTYHPSGRAVLSRVDISSASSAN